MSETERDLIAQRLATLRDIILDREGDDVQNQFEVGPYLITVNIEGNGYGDPEDEDTQTLFTLIQLEKGPLGMESLIATAIEQHNIDGTGESENFIISAQEEGILDSLSDACEKAYRHWHWLDLPNSLDGFTEEDEDELDQDDS